METINVTPKVKQAFEKERFNLRTKGNKFISQSDFLTLLILKWRKK